MNAGRSIHGDGSSVNNKTMQPDKDLGRDSHYRNKLKNLQPSQRDLNRTYGVPSIRSEIYHKKS